jgi:hypothetical protein
MAKDFVKVYNNFLKYEKDKLESSKPDGGVARTGLLAPKGMQNKKNASSKNNEMDKVLKYVEHIRSYRNQQ